MEKYIITDEDREHFITDKITEEDMQLADDGIVSIVRLSDGNEYIKGDWHGLSSWRN